MWKNILKKHKKKILIISLVLLVYILILFNVIPVYRGEIDFNANSVAECYQIVSDKFVEEKLCWAKFPSRNFAWRLDKIWSESGICVPCHQQNTFFQNCVQSLNQGHNIKIKIGLSKKTFHTWSIIDGQEIDVYYKIMGENDKN